MSAVSASETLKQIGVQGVSMKTHISPDKIRKLLEGEFEAFSPIQFNGFVTIIEREFDVDLAEWREAYAATAPEAEDPLAASEDDPFANAAKSKRRQQLAVVVSVVLLLVVVVVTYLVLGGGEKRKKIEFNNTAIEQAQANITALNASSTQAQAEALQEAHQDEAAESATVEVPETAEAVEAEKQKSVALDDVIFHPRMKLWLGVIDADTFKRSVYMTDAPIRLDGSKSWLIITGHGRFSLDCGGEEYRYDKQDRMFLLYEGGSCRPISEQDFKARNRGKVW